ncbi:hypothetical protein N7454_005275 [Penicillium verhagenii]|nr:hypothetical protein N7454_005275 [Penicillium verhagenii]
MYPPTHIIDPDGDVIIVLRNAGSPFARPLENTSEDSTTEDPAIKAGEPTVEVEEPIAESLAPSYIRIQVSAKHLMFASSVFKKLLTGGWKESVTYLQKGSVEINADDWDTAAFLIVLRAVHGQYYDVPRKLTLEMLAKVAVISDYYECKRALNLINEIWIENLEEEITPRISRDLILWLWIAWFFELPSQFEKSTLIAMSKGSVLLDSLGLPIPTRVIDSINKRRNDAIRNLLAVLHKTRDAFLCGKRGCGYQCRSFMYGYLTLHMQSIRLLSPRPRPPFLNMNYSDLLTKARAFKSPLWYDYNSTKPHKCIDLLYSSRSFTGIDDLSGLDLKDFIS